MSKETLKDLGFSNEGAEAADLQFSVREAEREQRESGQADYDEQYIRQSIVHAREDVVLLVSKVSGLYRLVNNMAKAVYLIAFLLIIIILVRHANV